jgi:hypothetical protein
LKLKITKFNNGLSIGNIKATPLHIKAKNWRQYVLEISVYPASIYSHPPRFPAEYALFHCLPDLSA